MIKKVFIEEKKLKNYVESEIKVMKELNSENIVKLKETFEDNDFFYLVLEYCKDGKKIINFIFIYLYYLFY